MIRQFILILFIFAGLTTNAIANRCSQYKVKVSNNKVAGYAQWCSSLKNQKRCKIGFEECIELKCVSGGMLPNCK